MDEQIDVADALMDAIERGDIDGVATLYAPDIQVWLNTEGVAQDRDANLRTLGWVVGNLRDRRYEDIRRQRTDTGYVQQHVLRATTASGTQVAVPACLVVTVDGDLITRIDEYLDSAHVEQLLS
jgi:uncharacterized protein